MRAAVYHGRHDIRIESVPEPTDPAAGEVVLEVLRAAICGTDSSEWSHGPLLARPPVVLGHEFVGRVVRTLGLHSTAAWPSSWRRRPRSAGSSLTPAPTTRRRWRSRWRVRVPRPTR